MNQDGQATALEAEQKRSAPTGDGVVPATPPPRRRFKVLPGAVKRGLLRAIQFVIRHPVDHLVHPLNAELAATRAQLDEVTAQSATIRDELSRVQGELEAIDATGRSLEERQRNTQASVASFELSAQELFERTSALDASHDDTRDVLERLDRSQSALRTELNMQRARMELVLREARRALPDQLDERQIASLGVALEQLLEEEYEALENVFRGTRDEIRERQRVYLEDLRKVATGPNGQVLDIGSGRGEWLELLRDEGIAAYGVDISERFVQGCLQRGLDARVGDGPAHVRDLPESSLAGVTAFHVIEHLPFEALVELVDGALRALRPGGILVLETPNPENLSVGASTFYIDPTHAKPVHPLFLDHLLVSRGFVDVELRYLHADRGSQLPVPGDETWDQSLVRLIEQINKLFFGPRDYAALAFKPSPEAD